MKIQVEKGTTILKMKSCEQLQQIVAKCNICCYLPICTEFAKGERMCKAFKFIINASAFIISHFNNKFKEKL